MINKTMAALTLAATALVTTACNGAKTADFVVNVHKPAVDDGPGGTVPNGCPLDGKTYNVVTQKYNVGRDGKPVDKVYGTGPEKHCVSGAVATKYKPWDRW